MPKCLTTEEFIEKSVKKFGNRYDYSKTVYIDAYTPVIITCPIHGDFKVIPHAHLKKNYKNHGLCGGCPICFHEKNKNGNGRRLTQEQFIKKAKEVHGNKYNYSKVKFVNTRSKVTIICPEHGEFYPIANLFLRGSNCPYCNQSKMENKINELLLENNIYFEREKTFEWLKNKISLSLDFYLPIHKMAIECQGKQHFETNVYFKHEPLENRQYVDTLKRRLCEEHGIKVIYYADYQYDFPYEVITDVEKLMELISKAEKSYYGD